LPSLTTETPIASTWFNSSSQITGWSYNGNGNVLVVGNMNRNFTYDAENRQTAAVINSTNASYAYDGLGQRVQKTVNGTTTYRLTLHINLEKGRTKRALSTPQE
jgi:YD repeat-containing protein